MKICYGMSVIPWSVIYMFIHDYIKNTQVTVKFPLDLTHGLNILRLISPRLSTIAVKVILLSIYS